MKEEIKRAYELQEFEAENKAKLKCEGVGMKSVVIADPEYFDVEVEGNAEHLPETAKKLYGCKNCEFKNWMCPFAFRWKNQNHANGICNFRINYLLSFTRGNKVKPRYAEWQKDFNLGIAQVKMLHEYKRMQQIQGELENRDLNPEKEEELRDEQKSLRQEWMELWKNIVKFEDKQVERETAKKLEVTHEKKVTLEQIHRIMRGDQEQEIVITNETNED